MSRFVAALLRIMVTVSLLIAIAMHHNGYEQDATYMAVLTVLNLLIAMDLERKAL